MVVGIRSKAQWWLTYRRVTIVLRRLRRSRTTGFRSTGLMKEGPETLFLFVFGELCLLLSCFGLICYTLFFICFILALFVVKISF